MNSLVQLSVSDAKDLVNQHNMSMIAALSQMRAVYADSIAGVVKQTQHLSKREQRLISAHIEAHLFTWPHGSVSHR